MTNFAYPDSAGITLTITMALDSRIEMAYHCRLP